MNGKNVSGKDPAASLVRSINQRLLNIARREHEEFQSTLTRYAIERLLYRLGMSTHAQSFILKGAVLFILWQGSPHRPTRDLDLLGYGSTEQSVLEGVFRDLCGLQAQEDALDFLENSVHGEPIREEQEYGGLRIHLMALLGKARIPLQIDIGFGDAVVPAPTTIDFPTLLDLPKPHIRAYARETVIAEKYQALVHLGMINTRMKDFYDIDLLARTFPYEGSTIYAAIGATFARRNTPLPATLPLALSSIFADDPTKQGQWQAFLRKGRYASTDRTLPDIIATLHALLWPPTIELTQGNAFNKHWPIGGPWQPQAS